MRFSARVSIVNLDLQVLRALENEPQIHYNRHEKITLEICLKKLLSTL